MILGKNLGIIPTEFTWLVASRDEMIWLTSELTSFYKSDDIDTLEAAGDVSSWALTNQKCSDLKMVAAFAGQSLAGKNKIDRHEGRHLRRQISNIFIFQFAIHGQWQIFREFSWMFQAWREWPETRGHLQCLCPHCQKVEKATPRLNQRLVSRRGC